MAGYNLERLNVLVVDDNRHMLTLVTEILRGLGIRNVFTAMDAAEGFCEMRVVPCDLVFCDWVMEPLDGLEFVRLVRTAKDSPNVFVPIVMLTGHTQISRVIEARDSGINEFLAKPISPKSIYLRILEVINKPRPFVRSKNYFGPDRRRRQVPFRGADRRVSAAAESDGVSGGALSQDQVNALLE